MNTDKLIEGLASEGVTKSKLTFKIIYTIWIAANILIITIYTLTISDRSPVLTNFTTIRFWVVLSILLSLTFFSIRQTIYLAVPRLEENRYLKTASLITFLLWIVSAITFFLTNDNFLSELLSPNVGISCAKDIVIIGPASAFVLFILLRRKSPTKGKLIGLYAMLSGLTVGGVGNHLLCYCNQTSHIFLWHILPVIIITTTGLLLGKFFIKNK